jgi:hypothetical protein
MDYPSPLLLCEIAAGKLTYNTTLIDVAWYEDMMNDTRANQSDAVSCELVGS